MRSRDIPVVKGGQAESGLDRALELALAAELDDVLETGLLWPEELTKYPPQPLPKLKSDRPWQRPIQERRDPPGTKEPLAPAVKASLQALVRRLSSIGRRESVNANPAKAERASATAAAALHEQPAVRVDAHVAAARREARLDVTTIWAMLRRLLVRLLAIARKANDVADHAKRSEGGGGAGNDGSTVAPVDAAAAEAAEERETFTTGKMVKRPHSPTFRFVDGRIGIVLVHGIGPQLAGQTLLDWTRPIITALTDWRSAHEGELNDPASVNDPVVKANIDFSGETFPVLHVRVPGIRSTADIPPGDPRTRDQRWVFTETWWATEVRPPTLSTMVGWLGEQGGVGRIVQGIQENQLGQGPLGKVARLSFGAFVSVIVSFVLLLFVTLLGISRLIPFGPLKNAVALSLAASFLTDWFGGARTLLRDPAQSANVRTRLVTTIKALRAYGCRDVVIVAHSGGTMVSFTSLTDPAYPRLKVQKLITIGEALNLGWRLEDQNPDKKPPTPPKGNRMRADLATRQPQLQWRDFWATHDPAPSGPLQFPTGVSDPKDIPNDPDPGRFTAERVYNRLNIGEDHGGYWDNDEHFVIPLIRELDVPTGDRTSSRFYSDADESSLRARRKERVSLLALWRRVTLALPVLAILAAATLTSPGIVHEAGDAGLAGLGLIPGHEILDGPGRWLFDRGAEQPFQDLPTWVPSQVRDAHVWVDVYNFGLLVLRLLFLLAIVQAVMPARLDRLWGDRGLRRLLMLAADLLVGAFIAGWLVIAWLLTSIPTWAAQPGGLLTAARVGLVDTGVLWAGVALVVMIGFSWLGNQVRRLLRRLDGSDDPLERFVRGWLIVLSSAVLAAVLLLLVVTVFGFILVFAGNKAVPTPEATRAFVVGAVLILVLFQTAQRVGVWRWIAWDIRERRTLRRNPQAEPYRNWIRFQAVLLGLLAVIGAILVAFGDPDGKGLIGDRGPWLFAFFAILIAVVMMSVGKDVVDADIETVDRDASTLVPQQVSKAPGSGP